ncbi:MAG: MFS transporter [Proteobacteria bacterium]|nr:MFS transporter [Pseudomonadota bacterium]
MTLANGRLSMGQILSYSLPTFSMYMILMTVSIYLPNFYTDELGVTAGMLSWVFLFGRVWDAVTDPAMGHISDRTRTRWGRRRPYFLVSILPIWLLFYLIWSPNPSLSTNGVFVHLLICYILLFTFWTVCNIPYYSLGMELTTDYHERSRLFGVRQGFAIVGIVAGTMAPVLFAKLAGSKVVGYSWMGAAVGGICVVLVLFMFFRVQERPEAAENPTYPFIKGLGVTFRNRAFVILMLVYLTTLIGQSFIPPLALYMTKYVIKEEWVTQLGILVYMGSSILSIPCWLYLSRRIGKKNAWTVSLLVGAVGFALVYTVHEGTWLRWVLCTIPTGAAWGCTMVLGPSIQADVIDSDELETGTRREGAFIGVWSFIDKAAIGLAIFAGLQGLELIGYVPNVEQPGIVIMGITVLYSLLPAVLNIIAVVVLQMFPITQEVHAGIRAQLDARKSGTTSRNSQPESDPRSFQS